MKKIILILIIIIISIFSITYYYNSYDSKDITNVAEHYVTTGIFNSNKLIQVDKYHLNFSDDNIAIITLSGTQKKEPHNHVFYKLVLEKKTSGAWEVIKLFNVTDSSDSTTLSNEEDIK